MPNYLLAYHGGGTPEGEEAQAAVMQAWNDWLDETGDAILDLGNPVGDARIINADGSVSANNVTGYSIIEADDMDDAIAIAKGCPILADGGSVEVAELVDMTDFDDEDEDDEDEDDDEE